MDVVINISGRLGNVMFQLAQGYEYSKLVNGKTYVYFEDKQWEKHYDTYDILHVFPKYTGDFDNFVKLREHIYMWPTFFPLIYNKNVFLSGCFESEDFHPNNLFVKELFSIPDEMLLKIRKKYKNIDNCVGISVRRGDYLTLSDAFYVPKIEWYFNVYKKYFDGMQAIVFSDDIEYCKRNLKCENFLFYENSCTDDGVFHNPMENLITLAMCKHHICSDSTFSWWGAKLLEREDSINIFQDKRFKNGRFEKNYIPDRWTKEPCIFE